MKRSKGRHGVNWLTTLALCLGMAGLARADLRGYLNSPAAASETPPARRALESLATALEELENAPPARYCGTSLGLDLQPYRDLLSNDARAAVEQSLPGLLARPILQRFFDTTHFRVHYSVTGDTAVLNPTDTAADGVPTYVRRAAEALERSWEGLIDEIGYSPPLPDGTAGGGTDLYDCYLSFGQQFFVIGFTTAETAYGNVIGNDTIIVATSYQVVHPTMEPFPQAGPIDLLRITCAHEFYHAIHFSLDAQEKPVWQTNGWWLEGPAVWFEDYAFPNVNDWSNIQPYFDRPYLSITYSENRADLHPYGGGSVWAFYLVERFGGTDILRDIWNLCGQVSKDNTLAATEQILQTHSSSLNAAWHEFSQWCMRTGKRWDDSSFAQGAAWPDRVWPDDEGRITLFNYPQAVHFTDRNDNLDQQIDPSIPVVTVDSSQYPLQAMSFVPVGMIPFPTQRPDSNMRIQVLGASGLPLAFHYVGLDTTLAGQRVRWNVLNAGDSTSIADWLTFDTMFVVASASAWGMASGNPTLDSIGDTLGRATPWLTLALDSASAPTSDIAFQAPFPNPFEPMSGGFVEFEIALPSRGDVWLDIFTLAGDRILSRKTTGDTWPPAQFAWDGRNDAGTAVASGLYLCKLTVELESDGRREEKLFRVGIVR